MGEGARLLLRSPGAKFTCLGYQYRVTEAGLECWGLDATGDMGWVEAEKDREKLEQLRLVVAKEPERMITEDQSPLVVRESAEQKQARIAESVQVLTELLDLACSCLNDPDPQAKAGAERDAKALAHAIKTLQGDPDA